MTKPAPPIHPDYEIIPDRNRSFVFALKHMSLKRTDDQKGLLLVRRGEPIAAVIYDWFTGGNFIMHLAAEPGSKWMTRSFLYWSFHYPFIQQRVRRVSGWVDANNFAARRLNEHLGFKLEVTLREAGSGGQDALIYVMRREDCRYV